jgi:lipopolysaccharide export system permease protein
MIWTGKEWRIDNGVRREFKTGGEEAVPFEKPVTFHFRWSPADLATSQVKPEQMDIPNLMRFISRVKESGGKIHQWQTDLHSRIAFPFSNVIIILLSAPLAYNRRKKSLAVGFGMSLAICFIYFGLIKMGQTLGHGGVLDPVTAAWLGNAIMAAAGVAGMAMTRK